jgi:Fur family ferric uptake transcriptional regulator
MLIAGACCCKTLQQSHRVTDTPLDMNATRRAPAPDVGEGPIPWALVRERLHAHGLRWTPQRRVLIEVLSRSDGHVTGAELVERCRAVDPATIPSTVYRTLDVLEELGIVRHAHGADGREQFHVLPVAEHGHLHCQKCRETWEIGREEAAPLVDRLRAERGFVIDLSHLSVSGTCRDCAGLVRAADHGG